MGSAMVDYSTATEFIQEHYGIPHYFGVDMRRVEPVYDARNGVLVFGGGDDDDGNTQDVRMEPAQLDDYGFALFRAPTQVQDFENLREVQQYYINELQDLIPHALGVTKDDVEALVMWHPTLRGEEMSIGPRSVDRPGLGPIASRVHIDTDVGAYGLEGVCNLVNKNRVDALDSEVSIKKDLLKACEGRRRMLLLNLWRPLVPVTSAPLGLFATKYNNSSNNNTNNLQQPHIFPNIAPSRETSQWYIYSDMQPDECLIFKQFDRRLDKQSDIWHCALNVRDTLQQANNRDIPSMRKRKSFDLKAMLVLKEQVPQELDRLKAAIRPILTWEESGEFCDSQAQKLKAEQLH
jgi:hypothetical protein